MPAEPIPTGVHDFDFLHGRWTIRNRRLRQPLGGSGEWDEFDGSSVERPFWGGQGNLEEYDAVLPDGRPLRGVALRLFDPTLRRWTIHWSNAESGRLDAPMNGSFDRGVGTFFGQDVVDGRPVFLRFTWTSAPPDSARWEQAFSADGGATWAVNWIMEFTRA